jgi:hypothetical protein
MNLPRLAGGARKRGALNNPAKEVISFYHSFCIPSSRFSAFAIFFESGFIFLFWQWKVAHFYGMMNLSV